MAPPETERNILFIFSLPSAPNAVSIVASSVSIETKAEARLIARAAEYTGFSSRLYLITPIIARVRAVKVYAASAMVVIS